MNRSLRVVLSSLVFVLPTLALAAQSGNLLLQGTVSRLNSLVVTPNGTANTSLNITGGSTGTNVAAVQETSNDPNGYTIQISSANAGELQLSTDATKETSYQISYDGGTYVSPTTTATTIKTVASLSALSSYTSQVLVNVTAYPSAVAGNYSDTVTFAIVAN